MFSVSGDEDDLSFKYNLHVGFMLWISKFKQSLICIDLKLFYVNTFFKDCAFFILGGSDFSV